MCLNVTDLTTFASGTSIADAAPFDFPIFSFWGTSDRRIKEHHVKGWKNFISSQNTFTCEPVEGNHLWPLDKMAKAYWLSKIVAELNNQFK